MRGQLPHEIMPRIHRLITFNKKTLTCSYNGEGEGTPAIMMWNYPLHRGWNYFEIEILDKGHACEISLGLIHLSYSLTRHVGWDWNSIGYHSDNGNIYQASGAGCDFGLPCTTGDIMGCGIDFDTSLNQGMAQVYFTKNGERIRDPFEITIAKGGLFPALGMNSQGERVRLLLNPSLLCDDEDDVIMGDPFQLLPMLTYGWSRVNTGISIEDNGCLIEHFGGSRGQDGLSLIQWSQPISRSFNCFRLEILNVVEAIAIGLASPAYPFEQFPGWQKNSIAYHSDDGRCFHGTGWGNQYGPTCKTGDVMALWVIFDLNDDNNDKHNDSVSKGMKELPMFGNDSDAESTSDSSSDEDITNEKIHVSVQFMKNGQKLGSIKTIIPQNGYYPTIGLMKNGEKIRVNMQPYSG